MVYQYVVTLRNNHSRFIDRFSLLLLFISAALFIREQLRSPQQLKIAWLFSAAAIIIIAVGKLLQQRRQPGKPVYYRSPLFIAAVGWVTMPYLGWLFIPFVLMALFERQAKTPLEIGFSNEQVVINTLFRRSHPWTQFNNVVLKDNLLTLDFKNNRLLQRETVDDDGDAGEDEFNDYCREQLARAQAAIVP